MHIIRPIICSCEKDIEILDHLIDSIEHFNISPDPFRILWTDGNEKREYRGIRCNSIGLTQEYPFVVNEAWKIAMRLARQGGADYLLFLDSDCTFCCEEPFKKLYKELERSYFPLVHGSIIHAKDPRYKPPHSLQINGRTHTINPLRVNGNAFWHTDLIDILPTGIPSDMPYDIWLSDHYCKFISGTGSIFQSNVETASERKLPSGVVIEHGIKDGSRLKEFKKIKNHGEPILKQ